MQCGIACIQMLCHYYGKKYSSEVVATKCFATTEGVSLFGIKDTLDKIGFETACARMTVAELSEACLPCILHWNQNHFVVLYKVKDGKKFYVADPGNGKVEYSYEEFSRHWVSTRVNGEAKGIAMMAQPTDVFYGNNEFDKCDKRESRSFRFLFTYINKYKKYYGQILLGLIAGCGIQLLLPFLTQEIVDTGIGNKDISFVWLILAGQLMLTFSSTTIDFIRRWLLLHISVNVNVSLISDFFVKLLKLPMSFFDTKLLGDLLQRMNDHNRVNAFLTQNTLNVAFSLLTFIVFSLVLLIYNKLIFLVFCIGSVVYGIWMFLFIDKRKVLDYELFEQEGKNQSVTYDFITSMQEIKLQNCENRRIGEWEDIQANLAAVQMKSLKLRQAQEAGRILINEVKNIVITVMAAAAVINGDISIGMMMAIQYIIGQLNSPIEQLMSFIYSLQDVSISLERINEIHNKEDENGKEGLVQFFKDQTCGIEFRNVSFKYDPNALKKNIDNVNITIPHGKVTAIVGASGSGKTTLLKLILGYYSVGDGVLSIGNTNICSLDKKWWRKQCGVVMQDGVIFSESIARNIAVDDGDIDYERLIKAAEIACIKDYILSLPLKFDTKIGRDGVGLSQGQKQRILIARAVYKNPSFIFLDEATNALDALNERTIVEGLDKFYNGKTVIIVAHRLSTVKNADQIIVVDNGKVVETGDHNMLVKKRGYYFNLVKNQLELGN